MKAILFGGNTAEGTSSAIDAVFPPDRRQMIAQRLQLYPTVIRLSNVDEHLDRIADAQVIFSTWGMTVLPEHVLDRMTDLRAVFYAAGSVQHFAEPYLERGVRVFSAWRANGVPVAEFTAAQVTLANKGYFRNTRSCTSLETMQAARREKVPGNFDTRVCLIGEGTIAQKVAELLAPMHLDVVMVSGFPERRVISLEEAFETSYVVSNHLADKDHLTGIFNGDLFARMPHGATFINTGRGRQVNEAELIDVLRKRPDLTALLDVQYPEPPAAGSALYELPNVRLSSHIAGSLGREVVRMADAMIEASEQWMTGKPTDCEVTLQTLALLA